MDIFDAIERGTLQDVVQTLESDPNAVQHLGPGEQPIHYAARYGKPDILDELVSRGADINSTDAEGRRPLHYAAMEGHVEPVRRLVYYRAILNPVDNHGFTPAVYAIRTRTPEGEEIVKLLHASGAEYDLHAAVARPDLMRVREILSFDPEAVRKVPKQEQLLIDSLIALSADVNMKPEELIAPLFSHGLQLDRAVVEKMAEYEPPKVAKLLRKLSR